MKKLRPIEPVKPIRMEIVFLYACPFCKIELPVISPLQPSMITCGTCRQQFPIVPIDEYGVEFVKTMMGGGPSAIDPDYL